LHTNTIGSEHHKIFTIFVKDVKLPPGRDVTIVTAFFDFGSFGKGSASNVRTKSVYHTWIKVFARIESPVVAYFDTEEFYNLFKQLPSNLPPNLSVIHRVNRTQVRKLI
jgi:hypothetical protein